MNARKFLFVLLAMALVLNYSVLPLFTQIITPISAEQNTTLSPQRSVAFAPLGGGSYTVLGWNNLGMHCLDADFSVFSILPPYNSIFVQVIDSQGLLIDSPGDLTVNYRATADQNGSINTTSAGKTNFWQFADLLFGLPDPLPVDVGLPVPGPTPFAMPGAANIPQQMEWEIGLDWFAAYGIPIVPLDDSFNPNSYPLMRLTAEIGAVSQGTTDIVLPVSDEMDCSACHSSGSGPAAMPPVSGWIYDPNPQRDYRLNILRLHDERESENPLFQSALADVGYNSGGLYATVETDAIPILCASCHLSEALPDTGYTGVAPLTQAVHSGHADVIDPANEMTLDSSLNRTACYRCHPGSETRCLRGAMGKAVAANGSMLMQCQSCHGTMSDVGDAGRTGWLDEPTCQNCHTGTASHNNGEIRYTTVYSAPGIPREAVDQTFATNPNTPATDLSLYRFSKGHGGLYCQACHGSTHAEFPSLHDNDNLYSIQHQGHEGMLIECLACHATMPSTVSGGPHGLHPISQDWVTLHHDSVNDTNSTQCQACHGTDYTGSVLSYAQADRTFTLNEMGTKTFWRGYRIGCYTCHNGPDSSNPNPNTPPVVSSDTVLNCDNSTLTILLSAYDPQSQPMTLRVVRQPAHGTVSITDTTATYFPEAPIMTGSDSFTFAAWDGQLDSNLGTIIINARRLADLNCDDEISLPDMAQFAAQWLNTDCTEPGWCNRADLNRSSTVDAFDFSIFAQQWLEPR